jgi:hypothetical protein
VDFGEFVKKLGKNYPDFNEFKGCISQWTGVLYNEITQKSFSGYFSQYLNHDETKVYFTKSLILNFIRTV